MAQVNNILQIPEAVQRIGVWHNNGTGEYLLLRTTSKPNDMEKELKHYSFLDELDYVPRFKALLKHSDAIRNNRHIKRSETVKRCRELMQTVLTDIHGEAVVVYGALDDAISRLRVGSFIDYWYSGGYWMHLSLEDGDIEDLYNGNFRTMPVNNEQLLILSEANCIDFVEISKAAPSIKFLHQWQNIAYILTGKELIVPNSYPLFD